MASCFDSGIYDTPYLNGVPYNARINGGKKVWSDEVSDYPPVYYDTRDLLMLINSGTNGEVDEDLNPVTISPLCIILCFLHKVRCIASAYSV